MEAHTGVTFPELSSAHINDIVQKKPIAVPHMQECMKLMQKATSHELERDVLMGVLWRLTETDPDVLANAYLHVIATTDSDGTNYKF